MSKDKTPLWDKEALMKKHDFNYIREHFFDTDYGFPEVRGDINLVYNDTLLLNRISAEGKNTVRVTNFFVNETQSKATSVRAKMSPYKAIHNDDALCEIFNRIDTHPRFFNIRQDTELKLLSNGEIDLTPEELQLYNEGKLDIKETLLNRDLSNYLPAQKEAFIFQRDKLIDELNKADLKEVRRAVAHMPSFHRVSQFPNHVAQRIYELYAPIKGGIILDSSAGWGNRLMATMSSKYGYKYLGTDPNSEMHPNYRALADTFYETIYEDKEPGIGRKYPEDYFDIRDQGSEFDIPEWHNMSGYIVEELDGKTILTNKFTNERTELPTKLDVKHFEKIMIEHTDNPEIGDITHKWEHPLSSGKGINDTGTYNTTGARLKPIMQTHDPEIYYSGLGDLSFTSPPYFFLECYTEDSQNGDLSTGQSAGKGANYANWIRDFMYPTIINHFNYLKPGGYYIYNLKDLPADKLYLYSDWLSACLDVGFELIEQPEMVLKSRRQFGNDIWGKPKINFRGATEMIGVLRKPLKHTDPHITNKNKDALFHIQNNFTYPLLTSCRPKGFESKLPSVVVQFLENKYLNKSVKMLKNHK